MSIKALRGSLQNRAKAIIAGNAIAIALVIGASLFALFAANETRKAYDAQYLSYLLADELRQSSDDLTRLARTYVVTAAPSYERQYFDVLAIRNGEKPRPMNYHRIYWDFVAAGDASPRPTERTVALQTMMQEAGFTDDEFALLREAQNNSVGLVGLEVRAMNAVKGKFADASGQYTIDGEPDLALARELMHSEEYHRYKADIMRPVDLFYRSFEKRTSDAVVAA